MVSERSVTGLKSAIYFWNSHRTNNPTPRKGKNFKKENVKTKIWYLAWIFAFPGSLIIHSMANQKQKKCTYKHLVITQIFVKQNFFWHKSRKFANKILYSFGLMLLFEILAQNDEKLKNAIFE